MGDEVCACVDGRSLPLEMKCAHAHMWRSGVDTGSLPVIFVSGSLTGLTSLTRLASQQIPGVLLPPSSQVLITDACGH